jgi:hypothetical protein
MLYNRNVYVRDFYFLDHGDGRTCGNCGTVHRGACPASHLVRRLERRNTDAAATIEAYTLARLYANGDLYPLPAVVQGPAEPV